MDLPPQIKRGDLIGLFFDTATSTWPHVGIILAKIPPGLQRDASINKHNMCFVSGIDVYGAILISHSRPKRGEWGMPLPIMETAGTLLDKKNPLYVCIHPHSGLFPLPGTEKVIKSVNEAYLGQLRAEYSKFLFEQYRETREYVTGRSFKKPSQTYLY